MCEYLQDDAEAVEDFKFAEVLLTSFLGDGLYVFGFELGFSLKLPSIGFDVHIAHVIYFRLEYFRKVSNLCWFELFVDIDAINLCSFDMVSYGVEFSFGEECSLCDSFGFDQ